MILLLTSILYVLGLILTAVGSRLTGRCATWCCALCGFPMWVVSGTVAALCVALPQLVLAFLASGLSLTGLAVGAALAGAVTDLGLVLALCLLRRSVTVDRGEFCRKCGILLAACLVLALFVRDGALSHTGAGLLMALFVLFALESIVSQHRLLYDEDLDPIGVGPDRPSRRAAAPEARTMAFPVMNLRNSVKNLAGVVGGLALLGAGAWGAAGQRDRPGQPDGDHPGAVGGHADLIRLQPAAAGRSAAPPLRLGLEEIRRALPHPPARRPADADAQQRHPQPDLCAAAVQPDLPRPPAGRRAVPRLRCARLRADGPVPAGARAAQKSGSTAGRGRSALRCTLSIWPPSCSPRSRGA